MGLTTLGVIGGAGWLGGALLRPALAEGVVQEDALVISSRSGRAEGFEAWPGVHFTNDNAALAAAADIVLLSIRPQDLDAIRLDLSGKLVISVMAMVTSAELASRFRTRRMIRAMPNACAEKRLSFTPWFASQDATAEDCLFTERFFASSGEALRVGSEAELNYFTALTGSGPAFLAAFADAMIRSAVADGGIAPATAERAVRRLFLGGSTLLAEAEQTPAEIVETFVSYAGTTAAGLETMAAADIRTPIAKGLRAAAEQAAAGHARLTT
ncbi:pyrroline-5-carboxylate reductase dimerization domain-containing protein [Sinorhizobium sp. 8-89]|uniref:pyrroline-5-carboxylate reductase family protein n=1 Tax=Sinorhizobium sp. 7-81 TaxID=3049087 RepID=UPI0024C3950A|nr:pyrroline-5-carboxylate reductase dimerization domain-containing protein [Sinorhizobium sp. 7-81]